MKKIIFNTFLLLCFAFLTSACSQKNNNSPTEDQLTFISPTTPPGSPTPIPTINPEDTLVTLQTSKGEIVIKLYSDQAPNTVSNFINKAKSGFYKNLIFHRVEPGFVIQGGDPTGTGSGGGEIKSELNDIPFKIGSVGLARTPVTKEISNDSQFYICLATQSCSALTGDYVNFGEVLSGMDIVQKIAIGDKIINITPKIK